MLTSTPGVKVAFVGPSGSGKSLAAALFAIGLCKFTGESRGAVIFDPDDTADFLRPVFELEGIPLTIIKATSFLQLREAFAQAEADPKIAAFLCDPYAAPRVELIETLKARLGGQGRRLAFHQRDELLALWLGWVRAMRASRLHCLVTGPGVATADRDDLDGSDDRALGGADADAWHEFNLVIELRALHDAGRHGPRGQRRIAPLYSAYVLKDRARAIAGRRFFFRNVTRYKPGHFNRVFDAFSPHYIESGLLQRHPLSMYAASDSSESLFASALAESPYELERRRAKIAIEEIHATIATLWPGKDANSVAIRAELQDRLFHSRSWTEIESRSADQLSEVVKLLALLEVLIREEGETIAAPKDVERVLDVANKHIAAAAVDVS